MNRHEKRVRWGSDCWGHLLGVWDILFSYHCCTSNWVWEWLCRPWAGSGEWWWTEALKGLRWILFPCRLDSSCRASLGQKLHIYGSVRVKCPAAASLDWKLFMKQRNHHGPIQIPWWLLTSLLRKSHLCCAEVVIYSIRPKKMQLSLFKKSSNFKFNQIYTK